MKQIILGLFTSWVNNILLIGFYFIESVILAITYNQMAPILILKFKIFLPIVHVSIWFTWGLFILIHFIGRFIFIIFPKIIQINK